MVIQKVQGLFSELSPILRRMLGSRLSTKLYKEDQRGHEKDEFMTITSQDKPFATGPWAINANMSRLKPILILVDVLALVPALQAADGNPERDKFLSELMCECDDDKFDQIGHVFFQYVESRYVHISSAVVDRILRRFESLLGAYAYSRSERLQLLAADFLIATNHLWLSEGTLNKSVRRHVRQIACWLLGMVEDDTLYSWRSRDRMVRFMDLILLLDPKETFWHENLEDEEDDMDEDEDVLSPGTILPSLGKDDDVRVRFSAALSCARLFTTPFVDGKDTSEVYKAIYVHLCTDMNMYVATFFMSMSSFLCSW